MEKEVIEKIMAENGRDIEREKEKANALSLELTNVKTQSAELMQKLESAGDVEKLKADLKEWQDKAKTIERESQAKLKRLETMRKASDFASNKKFANEITKEAITSRLVELLESEDSKGKSIDDLFDGLIEGKENVLLDESKPVPPTVTKMTGTGGEEDGVMQAFKKLNPNLKL
ncbi:MAG TPA: phage scaffolding protein [Treponemataceae bacterium]|nr:phage scaffolding protein [Treponemataceae bacterium]